MFLENTAAYLADFGVEAVFEGTSAQVLLDQRDEDILHGMGQSTNYVMTFAAQDFPDLIHGCAITVDGNGYQVHSVKRLSDGAFREATLFAV